MSRDRHRRQPRPDTAEHFPRRRSVRHKDSGIYGRVVDVFRHHDPDSDEDGRDYVTVNWGSGIRTDEPTATLEPFAG